MKNIVFHINSDSDAISMLPIIRHYETKELPFSIIYSGDSHTRKLMSSIRMPAAQFYLPSIRTSQSDDASFIALMNDSLLPVETACIVLSADSDESFLMAWYANRNDIPVAVLHAGFRSANRHNSIRKQREALDHLGTRLYISAPEDYINLITEGFLDDSLHELGNPIVDTQAMHLLDIENSDDVESLGLKKQEYILIHIVESVHPLNSRQNYKKVLSQLLRYMPVVMSRQIDENIEDSEFQNDEFRFCDSRDYPTFLKLQKEAAVVVTNSILTQQETTSLGVPCLSLDDDTLCPVTIIKGTNLLVGKEGEELLKHVSSIKEGNQKQSGLVSNWDGFAGKRIGDDIISWISKHD